MTAAARTPRYMRDQAVLRLHPDLVARLTENTDAAYPGRDLHARQIALVVLRAKGLAP